MKKGYIYIVLTALAFSTMEVAGKMVADSVNPFQLTFLRFLIGAVLLLPFALKDIKERQIVFNLKDFAFLSFTGFLCVVLCMSFFQLGIVYAKASTAAVIFSTNPVFTIPFAFLILGEKMNKKTFLSIAACIVGILFILNPFNINPDFKGILYSTLAAIAFSLYTVVGKLKTERYGGIVLNCFTFLLGDAMLLIILLIFKIPIIKGINSSNIFQIIYLGVVINAAGFLLYFKAMKETSAQTASVAYFMKPGIAPIFSLIILKESIPVNTILGIVFVLIGAYFTLIANNKKAHA